MVLLRRTTLLIGFVVCIMVLSQAAPIHAQEFEYVNYTVVKGDTLWGITKAHLKDAFQWPLVWRENLRINNPDLIYPGQVIRIPVKALGPGIEKVQATAATAPKAPTEVAALTSGIETPAPETKAPYPYGKRKLGSEKVTEITSREFILESGYISWNMPDAGKITGAPRNRKVVAQFDDIYIKTNKHANVGDKFYVVRRERKVYHPRTDNPLGYLVQVLGTIEVREAGTEGLKAVVLETFDAMEVGDILDYYFEVVPPFVVGDPRKPDINARIVAAKYTRTINANFDVVFIDKGSQDGLLPGDVIMTILPGTDDRRNGTIQLVNLRPSTSLGIILDNESEIRYGDKVEGYQETR